jgi:hypothetical protein
MDDILIAEAIQLGAATLHEAQGRRGDLPAAIRCLVPGKSLGGPAYTGHGNDSGQNLTHRAVSRSADVGWQRLSCAPVPAVH